MPRATSTWWAPGAGAWWTGVLFAIGSACFALGAAPGYVSAVGPDTDAVTFFVGSVFFTTAATFQLAQSGPRFAPIWWAGAVQLAGTLFFNASTFHAIDTELSAAQADQLVWTPDARGSVCFLVASGIAWVVACDSWWRWSPRDLDWSIAALNLAGSVAFGVSAVASYVVPTSGQVRNVALMNLGTFLGALCFLAGGLLLLPSRTRAAATS
jgi:hypothetical protein